MPLSSWENIVSEPSVLYCHLLLHFVSRCCTAAVQRVIPQCDTTTARHIHPKLNHSWSQLNKVTISLLHIKIKSQKIVAQFSQESYDKYDKYLQGYMREAGRGWQNNYQKCRGIFYILGISYSIYKHTYNIPVLLYFPTCSKLLW